MTEEYSYGNGKINYVNDKIGKLEQMEYQDNIQEILILENIIEELESLLVKTYDKKIDIKNDLVNLQNKIANFDNNKKKNIFWLLKYYTIYNVLWNVFMFFIGGYSNLVLGEKIGVIICLIPFNAFITLFAYPKWCSLISLGKKEEFINQYEEEKKEYFGLEQEELSLKEILKNLKERLTKLYNNKKREKESSMTNEIVKVNYRERLQQQRAYLELMYKCGYNKEEYLKLYQNGQLQDKLNQTYKPEEVPIIYDYVKEQVRKMELVPKND